MSRRRATVVMVQGCTSHAGKSYLAAGLCRLFANRGVRVAPFKAQNMSNNAGLAADSGEMGRAQIVQAAACRVPAEVRMNPVLLKPEADGRSQVVILGDAAADLADVPWHQRRDRVWPSVVRSLTSLVDEFDAVVIEGAGSPAEINLRHSDVANMAVARLAAELVGDCSVLLVSDIDRGGSFAHLLGTMQCLDDADRSLVRGFVLNKFRGDASLLAPAPEWLFVQTGVPVVGVVPMLPVELPEEDAVHFDRPVKGPYVAVCGLPRIANADEFQPLRGVAVVATTPAEIDGAAGVVIPGTKSTLADFDWLRSTGLAAAVRRAALRGVPVFGVCGGMQMLGETIADSDGADGRIGQCHGLGLLRLHTQMQARKVLRAGAFVDRDGSALHGYEIHVGRTAGAAAPWLWCDGAPVGWLDGNVGGAYAHGLFENASFRDGWLDRCGIAPVEAVASLDTRLDLIAAELERCLDPSLLSALLADEGAGGGR
jgi:adenosylcobyric acid synthase